MKFVAAILVVLLSGCAAFERTVEEKKREHQETQGVSTVLDALATILLFR